RFAFAYFHEPNFKAVVKPLHGFNGGPKKTADRIHYGTYFTNVVMRAYPDRAVTKKLLEDGRCAMLESDELQIDMGV
ncbi:hypothetical protein E4U24_007436, partial [Claviceps purpurea]